MLNKQVFSFFASSYFLRGNWSIENDPELCLSNVEAEVAISPATSISDTHSLTSEDASPAALLAGINTGHMHFFNGSSRLLCLYGLRDISTFSLIVRIKIHPRAKPVSCLTEIGLFIQ